MLAAQCGAKIALTSIIIGLIRMSTLMNSGSGLRLALMSPVPHIRRPRAMCHSAPSGRSSRAGLTTFVSCSTLECLGTWRLKRLRTGLWWTKTCKLRCSITSELTCPGWVSLEGPGHSPRQQQKRQMLPPCPAQKIWMQATRPLQLPPSQFQARMLRYQINTPARRRPTSSTRNL